MKYRLCLYDHADIIIDAVDDFSAISFVRSHLSDYAPFSLFGGSSSVVLVRPNDYILAYFDCFTGETVIKSMSQWVSDFDFSEGVYL